MDLQEIIRDVDELPHECGGEECDFCDRLEGIGAIDRERLLRGQRAWEDVVSKLLPEQRRELEGLPGASLVLYHDPEGLELLTRIIANETEGVRHTVFSMALIEARGECMEMFVRDMALQTFFWTMLTVGDRLNVMPYIINHIVAAGELDNNDLELLLTDVHTIDNVYFHVAECGTRLYKFCSHSVALKLLENHEGIEVYLLRCITQPYRFGEQERSHIRDLLEHSVDPAPARKEAVKRWRHWALLKDDELQQLAAAYGVDLREPLSRASTRIQLFVHGMATQALNPRNRKDAALVASVRDLIARVEPGVPY